MRLLLQDRIKPKGFIKRYRWYNRMKYPTAPLPTAHGSFYPDDEASLMLPAG